MMVTAKEFKKQFEEILHKVKVYEKAHDVAINVNYITDLFIEETYIEVQLVIDDEVNDEYTKNVDGFESKAKTYNLSKEIAERFEKVATTEWSKQVYC